MTQTAAIFLDAYRELNAKRLFWITLIISGVFVLAFALIGVGPGKMTFLAWEWSESHPEATYKALLLGTVVIGVWLTWAATILAVITTAGIFPEMISGGSIDLFLSKPISRLRLFLTKYATGLLFAFLQVSLVTLAVFVVVGFRLGEWKPALFLAIPIVICFYSYLFGICVLLGVATRSTVAAILLTLLAWLALFGASFFERQTNFWTYANEARAARFSRALEIAPPDASPATQPADASRGAAESRHDRLVRLRDDARSSAGNARRLHGVAYTLLTVLPKTGPTIDLLDRVLITQSELDALLQHIPPEDLMVVPPDDDQGAMTDVYAQAIAKIKVARDERSRSLGWVIGTSLLFEAVMLALAAWVFCRRDY